MASKIPPHSDRYMAKAGPSSRPVTPNYDDNYLTSDLLSPVPLTVDGFGAEILGQEHTLTCPSEALTYMEKDTRFTLRITNSNPFLAMVRIEIDGAFIGKFLLHGRSVCVLERPVDRRIGFMFSATEEQENPNVKSNNEKSKPSSPSSMTKVEAQLSKRSIIKLCFQPELGSSTMQFDVSAFNTNKGHRYEMPLSSKACDLFRKLSTDFGDWVLDVGCSLVHWTNPEYDSTTEIVMKLDSDMTLSESAKKNEPIRKMTLVKIDKLVLNDDEGNEVVLDVNGLPTFHDVIDSYKNDFAVGGQELSEGEDLYFLSSVGRYLGSTDWIVENDSVLLLLHKDEILLNLPTMGIKVQKKKPGGLFDIFVRVLDGKMHELEAVSDTTIRELQLQLASRGGPSGQSPSWLFCGTPLDMGKSVSHYGIRPRDTIDILIRYLPQNDGNIKIQPPIAVDDEETVCSNELLPKKDPADQGVKRGGTVLKARTDQQLIEVDAIESDPRFHRTLSITLIPQHENFDTTLLDDLTDIKTGTGCFLM